MPPAGRFKKLEVAFDLLIAGFVAICFCAFVPELLGKLGNCTFGDAGSFGQVNHCDVSAITPIIYTIQIIGFVALVIPAIFFSLGIALSGMSPMSVFFFVDVAISVLVLCSAAIKLVNLNETSSTNRAWRWLLLLLAIPCLYGAFMALSSFQSTPI